MVTSLLPTAETGVTEIVRYTGISDFGTIVNPMIVDGQLHGGVAQGIGQALFEQVLFDPDTGQILSGSLMDYALPRAGDLPLFEGSLTSDFPSSANLLGVKGSGQAGAIANCPQQGCVWIDVDLMGLTIDLECERSHR